MKAAAYLRRSTDRQEQSIGDQRKAIERFAAENGHEIVQEFCDDAVSGATSEDRREFLTMIATAQQRGCPFRQILTYDVSRFGRVGTDEAGHYRHLLSKAGIEVIYTAEGFRGDDTDDLVRTTKQWIAHRMVVDLSKVTLRGQLSRVEKGRQGGGRPPYGYDLLYHDAAGTPIHIVRFLRSGEREIRSLEGAVLRVIPKGESLPVTESDWTSLVPGDPLRVEVVRRIFDWYVNADLGYASIAGRLNAEKVPTASAGRAGNPTVAGWSVGTIRELLMNPAYAGTLAWNRRTFAKFHRVADGQATARPKVQMAKVERNAEADWIVIEDNHPALVPKETWKRAQRIQKARAGTPGDEPRRGFRRSSTFILAGLVECRRCRHHWQGLRIRKGRRKKETDDRRPVTNYYCCAGYKRKGNAVCKRALVRQEDFERVVVDAIAEEIGNFVSTGGAKLLEQILVEDVTPDRDDRALREKLAADSRKLDELVACLTPALAPVLEPKIVALRREIEATAATLAEARQAAVTAAEAREFVAGLVDDLGRISSAIATAPYAERREIVRAITASVVIDPERGEGKLVFHAIPKVIGLGNENGQTRREAMSGHYLVAGARSTNQQRTFAITIVTEDWELEAAA